MTIFGDRYMHEEIDIERECGGIFSVISRK